MRSIIPMMVGTLLSSLLLGCSSAPLALAPVGPNPAALAGSAPDGRLEVYSALVGRSEGDNPSWYQHTPYFIYDEHGSLVEHVANTTGYYARAPRRINLAPGKYLVKAQAKDYALVQVQVVIEAGRTTRIHLDGNWNISKGNLKSGVVTAPSGYPVGWHAG